MKDKRTRVCSYGDVREDEGSRVRLDVMHLVVLVNCSATMRVLEDRVFEALDSAVKEHEGACADVRITVILAGERTEIAVHCIPVSEFTSFAHGASRMRGCCMLMDALYETVLHMEDVESTFEGCVKVVIITNDAEATSCVYPYADVLALVEEKRAAGWEFKLLSIC